MEAGSLQEREDAFAVDHPEIPFSYIVALYADAQGNSPDSILGANYWSSIGEPTFPVASDIDELMVPSTPFAGAVAAGKCVLTPEMEIIECRDGHGSEAWAWDAILAHAGG